MNDLTIFSEPIELPLIPEGPGVCILENEQGEILQVVYSNNIRRRIGEMFDSQGTICAYGPKIYQAQQAGQHIFVRWKHTKNYKQERKNLEITLRPKWMKK